MGDLRKDIKDFIKQHEMKYFVHETIIHKAYKVTLEGKGEYWVWFSYGMSPEVLTERQAKSLLSTMDEAKALADKRRAVIKKKEDEEKADAKRRLVEATEFMEKLRWWDMKKGYGDNEEIKPEYERLVKAVKDVYGDIPNKFKGDTSEAYIYHLTRYIRTGMFYSQGLAFSKDQVVYVKYGSDGSVQVVLLNGVKVTPVSSAVSALIKLVFGERDSWSFTNVKYPKGDKDEITSY